MRKFWVVGAVAMLSLALAAIAYAQIERTNSYTAEGSVSPTKKGTAKKPVAVGINFNYTVGEASGNRPVPVERYSIRFAGLRQNSNRFPGCSAAKINANQGSEKCKGSLLGKGKITAVAGPANDPTSKAVNCPLNVEIHNAKQNKAAIYVVGGPNAPANKGTSCPLATNAALPANFVKRGNAMALEFSVPKEPFRFYQGFEVSVISVQSKLARRTTKFRGKTVGYFEVAGRGCNSGRRTITVNFTDQEGGKGSAAGTTTCK